MNKSISQVIKFYIVGAMGLVVNLGILFVLTNYLKIFYLVSSGIGFAVSVTSNYIGNKLWTFGDKINDRKYLVIQYGNFWMVSIAAGIIQLSLTYFFVERIGLWYVQGGFFAIAVASFVNFILNKIWTFRKK